MIFSCEMACLNLSKVRAQTGKHVNMSRRFCWYCMQGEDVVEAEQPDDDNDDAEDTESTTSTRFDAGCVSKTDIDGRFCHTL